MRQIETENYITSDGINFRVEIIHKKYARDNNYKLYKENEICAEGRCPKDYTAQLVFNYWVRDEGKIQTYKCV